jgi:excisionase family DNA binding protein
MGLVRLLRRGEAAERLAVSERTVRRWAAAGRLDERKIGPRAVRITEESVDRLVRAGDRDHEGGAAA